MKKIVLVIMLICCVAAIIYFKVPESLTEIPTEEPTSTIPDAKGFPEIEWPTFGFAAELPIPDWSNKGEILIDSETKTWIHVGNSTFENFTDYIEACEKIGYAEESYLCKTGIVPIYYAENAEGSGIKIQYNTLEHYLSIDGCADATTYDKPWLKED